MNDDEREKGRVNIALILKNAKETMPAQIELEQYLAKMLRIKFIALVNEGFAESQALDLCKTWKA